jgi:hypothetical protein
MEFGERKKGKENDGETVILLTIRREGRGNKDMY